MSTMTIDDILAEIKASKVGDDGMTVVEWAQVLGGSEATVRRKVRALVVAGKMIPGKAPRVSAMDGFTRPVPVYRVAA